MEKFNIALVNNEFQIQGIPDAVNIVAFDDHPQYKRLADLNLHRSDLEFANECLQKLSEITSGERTLRQALWSSAIIYFIKCFGANKRFQLQVNEILANDSQGLEVFDYFLNLRNKHIAHDVNAYAQSMNGAVLNNGKKDYKIEKIVSLAFIGETCEPSNFDNLKLLIQKTLIWVNGEFDQLCRLVSADLEHETMEKLNSRKEIKYRVPKVEEIKNKR